MHVRFDATITLGLGFARSVDVHHQSLDGTVVGDIDLCMSLAHSRKSIDFVADNPVVRTCHALDRHRVAPEKRDESIPLVRLVRSTRREQQSANEESSHGREAYVSPSSRTSGLL